MLVSIVITNYNYAAYLAQAIVGALNQTYPDVEVIVIDDGSSDNSIEIISHYAGRVIPLLKENSGHCACINLGFAMSRGEVVIFLDADDVLFDFAAAAHVVTGLGIGASAGAGLGALWHYYAEGKSVRNAYRMIRADLRHGN